MKVSILIVTYQSEDEILNCIKSIYQNVNKIVFEIIIIDNASTDKTIKIIKDNFPEITVIENEQNKGFSFANNLGAKSAKGEFLFF
jgi:Predicted glycosyltransferases